MYIIGEGANPNLPVCKKKKILRMEKKLVKDPNCVFKSSIPEQKSLEEFIAENDSVDVNGVKKLSVRCFKFKELYFFHKHIFKSDVSIL